MSELEEIIAQLEKINSRLDKMGTFNKKHCWRSKLTVNLKLGKHIEFIDKTYEGLKNPIKAATRFLGR